MKTSFDIEEIAGLTEDEAARTLKEEGYNEIPSAKKRNILSIAWSVVREPMFLLLVSCGSIYFFLGDAREGSLLLAFVFVVMGITLYQERKTERALEALRDLSSPRALVIRSGETKRIPGREVVRNDILMLAEGDRIPADAVLISSGNLYADESLLTGESVPVRKFARKGVPEMSSPGGDDLPFVYSGTLVVQGQGLARVTAVGADTEMGKIGKSLETVGTEKTSLQRETGRLVRSLALLGISLCILVIIVYGLRRGDWAGGVLAGITLAMAMLPEEFPVVLAIFLALGAWRISRKEVLTRRVPAVETLGAATVLCVDKTGTLTVNRMAVSRICTERKCFDIGEMTSDPLPEEFHELVEFSILASRRNPFDPMEKALKALGRNSLSHTEHLHDEWELVREYPLSQALLGLSHVWKAPGEEKFIIAAKGAPEAIADLCHMSDGPRETMLDQVRRMARDGLRVLGVARASFGRPHLPGDQHAFQFDFLGLLGFSDPVREAVPAAIDECRCAGIRVVMITGDYPETAQSIARRIGLHPANEIITGVELDAMEEEELIDRCKAVNIFARVVPEQKLRLVNALKANGEVVAMTGDGVNDAPALKSAHIGIAMGGRGTDVARESAALVLLNDDFSSIVQAVKLGRRIFDNLKKAMAYIFAIHVPIAGISLIPVIFNLPLVLYPVHIAFLELIIDPACSIAFEAEPAEKDVMKLPPRKPDEPLFGFRTVALSLAQGLSVLAIILAIFVISLNRGQGVEEARTLTFTSLIIANVSLILTNRSWAYTIWAMLRVPNNAIWWVVGGALFFLGLVLYVPLLRHLFSFVPLHTADLAICFSAGILSILWFEGFKVLNAWRPEARI